MTGVDKIRKALELNRKGVATDPVAHANAQLPAQAKVQQQTAELEPPASQPRAEPTAAPTQRPSPARNPSPRAVAPQPDRLRDNHIVTPGETGPVTEVYRMLRTQVLQAMRAHGYNSLAVLSPTSGTGCTTTAINLAMSIAEEADHTVLLVDMDLRRPGIAQALGLTVERGVESCLGEPLRDVGELLLRPEGMRKLTVLPAARAVAGSAELLGAESTRRVTREINARYTNRVVIYDVPAMLETADALAFLRCVDAALLVVREGHTLREDVVRTMHLLRETPVVGTVLNGARAPQAA